MKILAVDKKLIRNNDLGDYVNWKDGTEYFEIKKMDNEDYQKLIFLHEFVEKWLTEHDGIAEETINRFDAEHMDCDNPGELPDSPYLEQHLFAESIERIMCSKLGIDWKTYDDYVISLL